MVVLARNRNRKKGFSRSAFAQAKGTVSKENNSLLRHSLATWNHKKAGTPGLKGRKRWFEKSKIETELSSAPSLHQAGCESRAIWNLQWIYPEAMPPPNCVSFIYLSAANAALLCVVQSYPPKCGKPTNGHILYNKWLCFLQQQLTNNSRLLSKAWGMDSTCPIFVGVFVGLILYGSCIGNHSFCDFPSGTAMPCPDDGTSQQSFPSFSSYSPTPLWWWGA